MRISKNTIKELLDLYLKEKGIDCENKKDIVENLFVDVDNKLYRQKKQEKKEQEKEKKRAKTRVSHGTSCPRISNNFDDLLVEF